MSENSSALFSVKSDLHRISTNLRTVELCLDKILLYADAIDEPTEKINLEINMQAACTFIHDARCECHPADEDSPSDIITACSRILSNLDAVTLFLEMYDFVHCLNYEPLQKTETFVEAAKNVLLHCYTTIESDIISELYDI